MTKGTAGQKIGTALFLVVMVGFCVVEAAAAWFLAFDALKAESYAPVLFAVVATFVCWGIAAWTIAVDYATRRRSRDPG